MAKANKRTKKFLSKVANGKGDLTKRRKPGTSSRRKGQQAGQQASSSEKVEAKADARKLLKTLTEKGKVQLVVKKGRRKVNPVVLKLRGDDVQANAEEDDDRENEKKEDDEEDEEVEDEEEVEEAEEEGRERRREPENGQGGVGSNPEDDEEGDDLDMEMDMDRVAKEDPEFYRFLQEHDQEALDFGKEDDDGEEDDEEEMDDEDEEEQDEDDVVQTSKRGTIKVTKTVLDELVEGAFVKMSVSALRNIVAAFRQACTLKQTGEDQHNTGTQARYEIEEEVIEPIVNACLSHFRHAFDHHVFGEDSQQEDDDEQTEDVAASRSLSLKRYQKLSGLNTAPSKLKAKHETGNWKAVRPLALGALHGLVGLIGKRGATKGDPKLALILLKRFRSLIPYFIPFPRMAKTMLKSLLAYWSRSTEHLEESEKREVEQLRVSAYTALWYLSTSMPAPFLDLALKGSYLTYVRRSRSAPVSVGNAGGEALGAAADKAAAQAFMASCIVEMYGVDLGSSYQYGFLYIRQLALHLRTAYAKKTKESFSMVLSWQFLSSLRLWTLVLSAYPGPEELQPLIYPLTQVIQGTMKLLPTSKYLPLRLHCIRLVQQLAAASGLFCPTAMICVEILENPDLKKKPVPSTSPPPNIQLMIRLGGAQKSTNAKDRPLATHGAQSAIVLEAMSLIEREIEIYSYTLGLPEYLHAIIQRLRRFAKDCRSGEWRTVARGVADKAESASQQAKTLRARYRVSPAESNELEALLPQNTPKAWERLERVSALQQLQKHGGMSENDGSKGRSKSQGGVGKKRNSEDNTVKRRKKKKKTKLEKPASENLSNIKVDPSVNEATARQLDDEVSELRFSDED